ncbi:glycosyltransferase family 2 protein [Leeuwenhoekiella palythoae]|uniref:glycosyltransferase family 2 protein n=1 Tax=Leeuwenhoekiella palythoae TaxID=573501 RepID=UPI001CE11C9F|nr:glycosyltransferase family A protein [Leeuwenhoekiella palythoae]UBZ11214.1 glycosyltransferase family 2 protein [Leeuwenhoekiella palythoae]
METNTPLVSIIIPCYNDFDYVETAVKSAYHQTYKNKEILVVDDGSDLKTKTKIEDLKYYIDKILVQENKGQSAARNFGIQKAEGTLVLVLDSDDYFDPHFLELAVPEALKPNVSLVTCWARCFSNTQDWIYKPKGGTLLNFLYSNASIGNALFYRKECGKVGGYDEHMRSGWEDWEFYIRLMALGGLCIVLPKTLFNYRKRTDSTTIRANQHKFKLYDYIFNKHRDLYTQHFTETIDFFLEKLRREESEKIKNTRRLEYRLGKMLLYPLRLVKSLWS